tara:strand:- start:984 stop:1394 length:411 start_codon:yes stop_codon:yes gene_type:complete
MMPISNYFAPLRNVLLTDAAACVFMSVPMIFATRWLEKILNIPSALLFFAGICLLPVAIIMVFVATRKSVSRNGVALVVAGNIAWVVASLSLIVTDWIAPNFIGVAFIGCQAAAVTVFALLEYTGLCRLALAAKIN